MGARDNHLTQLMKANPEFSSSLAQDYGSEVRELQKRKAKDAYNQLLEGLYGAPLTILFASDNGNAENLSKRLGNRGKARGLKTLVMAMEDYPVEDLSKEENIVFVSATAGQGEFPQNGRAFWDAIKDNTELDLATVNYSVFALGDSHYWPRKEDKHYYNKPGKDLDRVLANFGAKRLAEIGLGDDQDPDGFQTGYQNWEPLIWQALGVDKVEGLPEEPPPITNEDIKIESNFLRGTIAEGLLDTSTGAIAASDQQLTKFHGTYMQDDRDLRDERKAQGLEPAYSFMIRCRLDGGVSTPKQWIQMDDISNAFGNETMKLTTRQTFQFHGVVKGKLKSAMRGINKALMTGCPNGCARPWLAEVAFVGKAYGAYNMYLGGGYHGQRLNKLYRSSIKEDEILEIMKPLLKRYSLERKKGEHFGDFCIRIGMIKETTEGKTFHDDVAEEESDEE